jgi:hypothetical protein
MHIPYSKPATLSDPYIDWEGSEAEIKKVIDTDPKELGRDAYSMIFYQHLPAANYEEGCFYVPFFLDYYARETELDAPDFEGFFWFIDHFREDFERDCLLEPILQSIWSIFLERTRSFKIHRLSNDELQKYGICESYREIVPSCRIVHEFLDCLTTWEVYDSVVTKLKEYFDDTSSVIKSSWFCECAFHTRLWLWVDSEPVRSRQDLFDYFHRFERFSGHYGNIIGGSGLNGGFTQYNQRISPN